MDMTEGQPAELPHALVTGQQAHIELFALADRVEAINGKLYMMGGCFTEIWAGTFPATLSFGVAVAVSVPWNATNQTIDIQVIFETQDGQEVGRLGVPLVVGRPPHLQPGDMQTIPFAIPTLGIEARQAGTLIARALLGGQEERRLSLRVRPVGQ